jgi:zinc transport system substrate-binding protein
MHKFRALAALFVCSALAVPAAFPAGGTEMPEGKTVVVSILPQAYFLERIAGGRFAPVVLVGPGASPHSYEPTPRQMAELSKTAAWLRIGIDFERGLAPKIAAAYPALRIVDVTAGVKFRELEAHGHEGEEADAEEEGGIDPHVWLGRQGALTVAANTRDALAEIDPAGKATYAANYDALAADIGATFDALGSTLAPLRGETVFVYHPAFGYFLDEFGIAQEAVETGGKEPTQKQLAALIAEAKSDGARVIFVQAQFPAAAAKTVADAIGGAVVPIDDLAPDWLDNLKRLAEAIRHAAR